MTWKLIEEFPKYVLEHTGTVRNADSGKIISPSQNQHGVAQVGLMSDDGVQYKRSLALLVARSFLDPPKLVAFTTPINLDGNRMNNHVDNLVWRPRWFAVKYHRQFHEETPMFAVPIIDVKTGEWFANSTEAVVKYGLLNADIVLATVANTVVWPSYQKFRVVDD